MMQTLTAIFLLFISFSAYSESIKIDMGSYSWSDKNTHEEKNKPVKAQEPKKIINIYESGIKDIVSEYKKSIQKKPKKLNYQCDVSGLDVSRKYGIGFITGYLKKENNLVQLDIKVIKNGAYGAVDILDKESILVSKPNGYFEAFMNISEQEINNYNLSFLCSDY